MSAVFESIKVQERFKKPVSYNYLNPQIEIIVLQSSLLGANDFDIRVILALTGDPAKLSDQPEVKGF